MLRKATELVYNISSMPSILRKAAELVQNLSSLAMMLRKAATFYKIYGVGVECYETQINSTIKCIEQGWDVTKKRQTCINLKFKF